MLKSTGDTWTNQGAEKWSSIPNTKLAPALGYQPDHTLQPPPQWRYLQRLQSFPERGEAGPIRPPEDDYWVTVRTKGTKRKRCAWGQNTRLTGHSLPYTAPRGGPWCQQSCPEHTQTRCWACSWYLKDTSKPPGDTHLALTDKATLKRWDRGKMSSKKAESLEPIINLNNSELEGSQRH